MHKAYSSSSQLDLAICKVMLFVILIQLVYEGNKNSYKNTHSSNLTMSIKVFSSAKGGNSIEYFESVIAHIPQTQRENFGK